MSNTLDDEQIRQLRVLMASIAEISQTKKNLESLRDDLVCRFRAAGVPAIAIVQATGLTRSRVYQILEQPVLHDDDPDAGVIAAHFQKRFEDALEWAWFEWEEAGRAGDPDDYFPLEHLVRPVS